jgi:hypothetical protein
MVSDVVNVYKVVVRVGTLRPWIIFVVIVAVIKLMIWTIISAIIREVVEVVVVVGDVVGWEIIEIIKYHI